MKRTLRITTWGGGSGTFWQKGSVVGMVWERIPNWRSEVRIDYREREWDLGSVDRARHYFNTFASHY